ncbi:MAG: hypothetical protein OXE44_07135 [Nitrospinae bacterium]|nr:hypothetical protein [Nitrospinota bacterium]
MTEYEAANLAVQQAALALQKDTLALQQSAFALQKASLALQEASLAVQQASVWVAALVGAAQCSLIGFGLYIMRQASIQRDALHQETMAALQAQRDAQREQHRETMKALEGQNNALMELIRRTSAPSAQGDS